MSDFTRRLDEYYIHYEKEPERRLRYIVYIPLMDGVIDDSPEARMDLVKIVDKEVKRALSRPE